MPRTMSQEEHKQFNKFIGQKRKELTNKQDIINFLNNVGFCDKNGRIMSPYDSLKKEK